MRTKTKLTLEQHLEIADDLAMACHYLNKVFDRCQDHYPKTSRLMRTLYKLTPGFMHNTILTLQCELDSEYHAIITDAQFRELGNIYYNLDKRYKELTGETPK